MAGEMKIAKERTPMKNNVRLYIAEKIDERIKTLNISIEALNSAMKEDTEEIRRLELELDSCRKRLEKNSADRSRYIREVMDLMEAKEGLGELQ